ncbi:hypothetical protein IMY05_C4202000100 [Salix suchowensis]|nr:hypothetical protein IMY05_C4202000100 [Salix suchowensis]
MLSAGSLFSPVPPASPFINPGSSPAILDQQFPGYMHFQDRYRELEKEVELWNIKYNTLSLAYEKLVAAIPKVFEMLQGGGVSTLSVVSPTGAPSLSSLHQPDYPHVRFWTAASYCIREKNGFGKHTLATDRAGPQCTSRTRMGSKLIADFTAPSTCLLAAGGLLRTTLESLLASTRRPILQLFKHSGTTWRLSSPSPPLQPSLEGRRGLEASLRHVRRRDPLQSEPACPVPELEYIEPAADSIIDEPTTIHPPLTTKSQCQAQYIVDHCWSHNFTNSTSFGKQPTYTSATNPEETRQTYAMSTLPITLAADAIQPAEPLHVTAHDNYPYDNTKQGSSGDQGTCATMSKYVPTARRQGPASEAVFEVPKGMTAQ